MKTDKGYCQRCRGCGQIANSDEGEPWVTWENLPEASKLAVRMGLVRPIPCPDCRKLKALTMPKSPPDSDRDQPLDENEVRMLRAYLDKFPAGPAPENMPYIDILRLCATMESLMKDQGERIEENNELNLRLDECYKLLNRLRRCDLGYMGLEIDRFIKG